MPAYGYDGGKQSAGSGIGGGNPGGTGGRAGGPPGGGYGGGGGSKATGTKQTGMSQALLNAKYPGAVKKKSKSFEASLDNLAKVGTLVGDVLGGPLGMAELAGETAVGTGPLSGPGGALNPFSGQGPDVPSVGAGFADNNAKDNQLAKPAERAPVQPEGVKKKKPVPPGFQLLEGAGGSLLGS